MKTITFILILMIAIFTFSCDDYYKEPQPIEFQSNYDSLMFNLQIPNILKAIQYEIDDWDEEENYITAYKWIDYNNNSAKLYFEVTYNEKMILNTYIKYQDKKYYIDKEKHPEAISEEYIVDVETFIGRAKGGKYPNRP